MIKPKIKIATTPFSGYLGCYISFFDIDEHLVGLLEHCCPFDIGLIEDGVCNAENLHVVCRSSTPKIQ